MWPAGSSSVRSTLNLRETLALISPHRSTGIMPSELLCVYMLHFHDICLDECSCLNIAGCMHNGHCDAAVCCYAVRTHEQTLLSRFLLQG